MSLYDDFDGMKGRNTDKVAAWSSGIKLLQSQLQLKKAATTQPKRDSQRKAIQVLPPVIDLKSKRDEDDPLFPITPIVGQTSKPVSALQPLLSMKDFDWDIIGEYDPMWPNDYDKVVKELREHRDREIDKKQDDKERKNHKKRKSRFGDGEDIIPEKTMLQRPVEDEMERSPPTTRTGGAAIAPPPSLQESGPPSPGYLSSMGPIEKPGISVGGYGASSVAAKIMAKYGFKEGQGLGKKEQGMSIALQVEKTSKRGGRIIHEKDGSTMPPPPPLCLSPRPGSPPLQSDPLIPVPLKPEPTITEIMKSPSKVVLLRNMVGPGDVDEDLEPEVKDECNTKYGDVIKVVIFEIPGVAADEAVRIFVEFKRIESAIKAVVDLNGRFFGGRQVKAGFYSVEKFAGLQLLE